MTDDLFTPLAGYQILSLATNLPGPVAARRLQEWGAQVIKIEPPAGDPLAVSAPAVYRRLTDGQTIQRVDLKSEAGRVELERLLAGVDLLLTSSRPAALERLRLGWSELAGRFPRLVQVAIIGFPRPDEYLPGHDLNYQAAEGLLRPPFNPPTLLADMAGAEMAVSGGLALLLGRARSRSDGRYLEISLAAAAAHFALPLRSGLTAPGGILGGGWPGYRLYEAADGWVALAALEPHFWIRLGDLLALKNPDETQLAAVFKTRTAGDWEAWGLAHDLPLNAVAVHQPSSRL